MWTLQGSYYIGGAFHHTYQIESLARRAYAACVSGAVWIELVNPDGRVVLSGHATSYDVVSK